MKTRTLRRIGQLLAVAALMLVVFAPVGASAQTDYPTTTPPTQPTVVTSPSNVSAQSATSSGGGTLAFTGGNIALLLGIGLAAAVGGVVLVRVGRRRAHATQ